MAVAMFMAVVGMLAIGGAYNSAVATPGNGNGNANGRPCDGCVGNADDKTPPGQSNGDKNKGYECDDNHGVGQGNPAHSGVCNDSVTSTTVGHHGGGGGGDNPTTTVAPDNPSNPTEDAPEAEVLGVNETQGPAASVAGNELARTGSTAETFGYLALALFAFGYSAILFTRRDRLRMLPLR